VRELHETETSKSDELALRKSEDSRRAGLVESRRLTGPSSRSLRSEMSVFHFRFCWLFLRRAWLYFGGPVGPSLVLDCGLPHSVCDLSAQLSQRASEHFVPCDSASPDRRSAHTWSQTTDCQFNVTTQIRNRFGRKLTRGLQNNTGHIFVRPEARFASPRTEILHPDSNTTSQRLPRIAMTDSNRNSKSKFCRLLREWKSTEVIHWRNAYPWRVESFESCPKDTGQRPSQ
jgi:hypothetical protein